MMVTLPTNTVISIRQRSVEMVGNEHREAVVSFEMFAYPADNGGKDGPVVILPKTVPFSSKDPASTLRPDYERMVMQAAGELTKDFDRMRDVLNNIAHAGVD